MSPSPADTDHFTPLERELLAVIERLLWDTSDPYDDAEEAA